MVARVRVPARRNDLSFTPFGEDGQYVVRDAKTGAYFKIGEQEYFLLDQLDGRHTVAEIQAAFRASFGEDLPREDLQAFLRLANQKGFLEREAPPPESSPSAATASLAQPFTITASFSHAGTSSSPAPPPAPEPNGSQAAPRQTRRQSLLAWRVNLFDPDRLFTWLAPKIGFFWTPAFVVLSALFVLTAVAVAAVNSEQLASRFAQSWSWQTMLVVAAALLLVTILHEFAHGLTCKHFGGRVREIGFLMLSFLPCLYCNVSDAWRIPQKSRRLWITLAGGYAELCLWGLAVFVWRLTVLDGLLNYLAVMVVTVSGFRIFFNFNPFLKLDGYYLLSDYWEIPNLRRRALDYVAAHLRWLFWGAARPERDPKGRRLLAYGVACWIFSFIFLGLMALRFGHLLGEKIGWAGTAFVAALALVAVGGLFRGLLGGELRTMLAARHKRTGGWLLGLGTVTAVLALVPMEKRASGTFDVRPQTRVEVRAQVAGFLAQVSAVEGDRLKSGAVVARLKIPDLDSRIAQKRAEIEAAEAKLRLLETGPGEVELAEQRRRVERARHWRDLAKRDLARAEKAFQADVTRLDQKIAQYQAEVAQAAATLARTAPLVQKRIVSQQQHRENEKQLRVAQSLLKQARAEKKARLALGTVEAHEELARREKALADEIGAERLLKAGPRDEEIEAQRARRALLKEELAYLEGLEKKLVVRVPAAGVVTTPRLEEKIGQYLNEGDLICEIEAAQDLEIDITLPEQEIPQVRPGQRVELKARSLPFRTFVTTVDQIAPSAKSGELHSTVVVHCHLERTGDELRSGMTGYARIDCGQQPIGRILADNVLRYVRTEFWW